MSDTITPRGNASRPAGPMPPPTDLVRVRLGIHDGDLRRDLLDIAAHAPVVRTHWAGGEIWVVNDLELGCLAFRDDRLSKEAATAPPWFQDPTGQLATIRSSAPADLVTSEGHAHKRIRKLHTLVFAPHHKRRWADMITGLVRERLRVCAAAGAEVDLVPLLAYPLPVMVISSVLGLPPHMHDLLEEACRLITYGPRDSDRARGEAQLFGGVGAFVGPRRGELRDGMIADLLALHDADGSVSTEEIARWTAGLVIPGHESTTSVLAAMLWDLLNLPREQRPVGDEEIDAHVEEVLRHNPPFPLATWRFSTTEVRLGDHVIPQGMPVLLNIPSFNRERERRCPADARRSPAHYTFGHGIHYCIGAPLARVELRATLTEFQRAFPDAALVSTEEPEWMSGFAIRQLTSLPVRLRPIQHPAVHSPT
jgi:cytochrome P450